MYSLLVPELRYVVCGWVTQKFWPVFKFFSYCLVSYKYWKLIQFSDLIKKCLFYQQKNKLMLLCICIINSEFTYQVIMSQISSWLRSKKGKKPMMIWFWNLSFPPYFIYANISTEIIWKKETTGKLFICCICWIVFFCKYCFDHHLNKYILSWKFSKSWIQGQI